MTNNKYEKYPIVRKNKKYTIYNLNKNYEKYVLIDSKTFELILKVNKYASNIMYILLETESHDDTEKATEYLMKYLPKEDKLKLLRQDCGLIYYCFSGEFHKKEYQEAVFYYGLSFLKTIDQSLFQLHIDAITKTIEKYPYDIEYLEYQPEDVKLLSIKGIIRDRKYDIKTRNKTFLQLLKEVIYYDNEIFTLYNGINDEEIITIYRLLGGKV